jgi:sulfate adenylyltransferase subunit 2
VAGQFERPALLFSGGKDSITLVQLALKRSVPASSRFRWCISIPATISRSVAVPRLAGGNIGEKLIVRNVGDTIKEKKLTEPKGKFASRNALQTYTLLDTIEEFGFDCCIGGARRDEEKARAKERVFSVRDEFGQWDPKRQRPSYGTPTTVKFIKVKTYACFPISNWTELDVWNYIKREGIALPSIYFSHERDVIEHDGQLVAVSEFVRHR